MHVSLGLSDLIRTPHTRADSTSRMSSDHLHVNLGLSDLRGQLGAYGGPPPLWMLNICRASCGFCQQLAPTWQMLAVRMSPMIGVSYWDIDALPELPDELGDVRSTPSIIALIPQAESTGEFSGWSAVQYSGSRRLGDLIQFATQHMPDHATVLDDEVAWTSLEARAQARRVPRAIAFFNQTSSSPTPAVLRALSVAYSGRVELGQVRLNGAHAESAALAWARHFGVLESLPALVALPASIAPPLRCPRWTHKHLSECLNRLGSVHVSSSSEAKA